MKQANILKNGLWLLNNLKFSLMAATLCCCHFFSYAQNRNSVWCFGDSALIDFSDTSNIIVGSCGLDTRGSCASIANENGKLLFYAETRATISGNTTLVFDTTHQVMQNGNNIVGRGWYQELVIVPNPANDSTYYLFSIGVTELYDFDRCTGLLSNLNTVYPQLMQAPLPWYWSTCFSPDDNLLYISSIPIQSTDTSRLYQFDLTATNIAASADTLRQTHFNESMGIFKLAPDGKIYLATSYYQYYPYKDTMYNNTNMYLSTINSPNNLGSACDLQPYSFYLGGKRTYGGLPNNPDYTLPAISGSPCDTLTGIAPLATSAKGAELFVTYMASWQRLFVNAQHLKGKNITLTIYDITGKLIYNTARRLSPSGVGGSAGGYFTQDVNCSALAKGMYIVSLQTEKERLVNKFIVE
jgi:hypothetical protein